MNGKPRILILSAQPGVILDILPKHQYEINCESSSQAAKRRLSSESFAMVILAAPLADEFGIQSAIEIASVFHQFVLLFVPRDKMDAASYQSRETSVFVSALPIIPHIALQLIDIVFKAGLQTRRLQEELAKSRQKLQDEKLISQCKLKLIENYHWSEEKAHAYLGKTAMDHSTTRANVARILLNKIEQKKK